MKSPDVGLMSLWTGEISNSVSVMRDMTLTEMTPEQVRIFERMLITLEVNTKSMREEIQRKRDAK